MQITYCSDLIAGYYFSVDDVFSDLVLMLKASQNAGAELGEAGRVSLQKQNLLPLNNLII